MYEFSTLLIAVLMGGGGGHPQQNPLYARLISDGVAVEGKTLTALPGPTLTDGMDASAQEAALQTIVRRAPLSELVRDSIVAPYVMSVGDLTETDAGVRIRSLDIWFVVHADLPAVRDNRRLLEEFLHDAQGDVRTLSPEELAEAGIEPSEAGADRSSYTHGSSTLLDRVQLSVATHTVYSQSDDSTILAGEIDGRFADCAELANCWRPIEITGEGKRIGPAQPYRASAFYWKATQLIDPAGAVLLEYHSVFEQPSGWFGGRDLLKSKLPMAVQSGIRTLRRKLKKANQAGGPA